MTRAINRRRDKLMQNASRIELHPTNQHVQLHVVGKLLAGSIEALELRDRTTCHGTIFHVKACE